MSWFSSGATEPSPKWSSLSIAGRWHPRGAGCTGGHLRIVRRLSGSHPGSTSAPSFGRPWGFLPIGPVDWPGRQSKGARTVVCSAFPTNPGNADEFSVQCAVATPGEHAKIMALSGGRRRYLAYLWLPTGAVTDGIRAAEVAFACLRWAGNNTGRA